MHLKEAVPPRLEREPVVPRPAAGTRLLGATLLAALALILLVAGWISLPQVAGEVRESAPEGMVRVTGGSVLMPAEGGRPAHWAVVNDFWMDRRDVKEADFDRFAAATGYVPSSGPRAPLPREDARAYAAWAGKRLPRPSEMEWIRQKGLVAADQTPDGRAWIGSLGFRCVKSP